MIYPLQNRMRESLYLFESVINSRWFLRTSIILFLNHIDVFKQKLPKVRFCPIICSGVVLHCLSLLPTSLRFLCCPSRCSLPLLPHCCAFVLSLALSPYIIWSLLFVLAPLTLLPHRVPSNATSPSTQAGMICRRRPSSSCGSSCKRIARS